MARAAPPEYRARAAVPVDSLSNRHKEALRQWQRRRWARLRRERDVALFELWRLSEPEVWAAINSLAAKLSESLGSPGSIGARAWLSMHGMTEDEARHIAYPGVWRAAESFDPTKGAAFQTYAFYFIYGELYRHVRAVGTPADIEVQDTEAPGRDERGLLRDRLLLRVCGLPPGARFEHVIKQTASLSSADLDELSEELERLYPDWARSGNTALEIFRAALLAGAARAADREGKMAAVSDLTKMLRAKVHREHMKKKYRSNSRLAREFGVSDQTVGRWLAAAEEQRVVADDFSFDALDRLARIMTPRRGPRAGRKPHTPNQ